MAVGVIGDSTIHPPKGKVAVDLLTSGEVAIVHVTGLVDERFAGFGAIGAVRALVIDVSGMSRMTSFGVRQWLKALEALPKTITERYLLGCPTFFVDQLNMVLNFGGGAHVLTAVAPFTCAACGDETAHVVDLLSERANLVRGPQRQCAKCGGKLELDEAPESYFAFAQKYGAATIQPNVAQVLAQNRLYYATQIGAEKPPKIIKLVQGAVTYFRIIGTIGTMFRSRPFIVGAEGEVVLDLAETDHFDTAGQAEWRRLLKGLSTNVPSVTLVDIHPELLAIAPESVAAANNIFVASVVVPYRCVECGRASQKSYALDGEWPLQIADQVCTTCGGTTRGTVSPNAFEPLHKASTLVPSASAKLIARRDEVLSRALTDAKVAQAGKGATDETIIGNYKIVKKLSAGGMAEVFLANQIGIGGFEKPVALKRIQRKLLEQRHLAIDMFLNEAKIAGRLAHPNIVQVLDVGEVGGALYLAMEYVRGKDLRDVIKMLQANGAHMPLGLGCYVVREIAQALHHAYWSTDMEGNRLSVVHRDVSPHNVILSYDGAVKLLDFGVAMSSVTEHDAEGMIAGKWHYMSPEHTTNNVDHRSDLFSLGVILYLLASGRMPFTGSNLVEIVDKVAHAKFATLRDDPTIPEPIAALVESMLAPNPDDRPQTGQEVASTLLEISRAHHLETTPADLAHFLARLFMYELAEEATGITEVDQDIDMDLTTIRMATGSAPTQTQDEQKAYARPVNVAITPSGLVAVSKESAVTFTPRPRDVDTRVRIPIAPLVLIGVAVLGVILALLLR